MKEQRKGKETGGKKWKLSLRPLIKYTVILCILLVVVVLSSGVYMTIKQMDKNTTTSMQGMKSQIEYRINQSVSLLRALSTQERFYNTQVLPIQKVQELDKMSEDLGYMMMCYVDENLQVYDKSGPADLSSREYLQQLFMTGEYQITDSFAAGSDGVTLNYTVAYPLTENQKVNGCLFSAIYFDEIADILKEYMSPEGVEAVLIGSQGQIMSSMDDNNYGEQYITNLKEYKLVKTSVSAVEDGLLTGKTDSFWSFKQGNLYLTSYAEVEGTNWNIMCITNAKEIFKSILPGLLPIVAAGILLFGLVMFLIRRSLKSQLKVVDMLVDSVEKLEQKLYENERPDNVDFNEVLHLTSTGLSDGLTGVVTRSVFMNKLSTYLGKWNHDKIIALCFVDLDDLKILNDTYGHEIGDISLKSIGYVLREYEKKYEGLVGRYGGDEFILVLSDLDSEEELKEVLDELALRLCITIEENGKKINIKCSVGVSVWSGTGDEDAWIKQADEALYFVKQNGKGYYRIYQEDGV